MGSQDDPTGGRSDPGRHAQTRREVLLRALGLLPAAFVALAGGWWHAARPTSAAQAQALNLAAWEATYLERGASVPYSGPREGIWGERLRKVADRRLGWREGPVSVPGRITIDGEGFQRFGDPAAEESPHILIVGGSVASGAYASTMADTYFAVAIRRLADLLEPARVTVFAAGAWKSEQDVEAAALAGRSGPFDVVVYVNGLNDLTNGKRADARFRSWDEEHAGDYDDRVRTYLANMKRAVDLARANGQAMLMVLQPSLAERTRPSRMERELLAASMEPAQVRHLRDGYAAMRAGLRDLVCECGVHFLDGSRLFDRERATTFTDSWHFSDPGHRILGRALAVELASILAADRDCEQPRLSRAPIGARPADPSTSHR